MLIIMLETHRGSEDGFVVRCFESAQQYDVADMLARAFISKGWAMEITKKPAMKGSIT